MPNGTWAPTTPEYLTAPGYQTYAPTAAYAYSPTGGDWSGAYPGYGGGGGGGGSTSGDYGGGTDTGTLGGLLSAASLLGGANDLSSFLTGKGLLEHAGIDNPFSGLLDGGGGLNLEALNPYSNTPLTSLFGEAGRNLGLAPSAFPNALPGGVGGSVGIGPSGYLSPDALAGISNAVPPGSPSLLPSGAMAPTAQPPGIAYPEIPYQGPYQLPPAPPTAPPVNLNVPAEVWNQTTGEFNFVQAGEPATGQFTTAAGLSNPSSAAEIAAGQSAEFGAGGFAGVGSPAAIAAANNAALGFGGVPITAAAPGLEGAGLLGSGQLAAGAGAAGAALGGGAGIAGLGFGGGASGAIGAQMAAPALGSLAAFAPAAMLAAPMIFKALTYRPPNFTDPVRIGNEIENLVQGDYFKNKDISGLASSIYNRPNNFDIMQRALAADFSTVGGVDGGEEMVGWSPEAKQFVNDNMAELVAARDASAAYNNSGLDGPRGGNNQRYHPTYNPDPNTYETYAGEYGVPERRMVGGPDFYDQMGAP